MKTFNEKKKDSEKVWKLNWDQKCCTGNSRTWIFDYKQCENSDTIEHSNVSLRDLLLHTISNKYVYANCLQNLVFNVDLFLR